MPSERSRGDAHRKLLNPKRVCLSTCTYESEIQQVQLSDFDIHARVDSVYSHCLFGALPIANTLGSQDSDDSEQLCKLKARLNLWEVLEAQK